MFGTDVSDMQSGVSVSGRNITGTLKYLDEGALVDTWGAGNFIALKFSNFDANATSVKVGLDPSQSSGLVEILTDPDKNGAFKITNKDTQVFKVVTTISGGATKTDTYTLSGNEYNYSFELRFRVRNIQEYSTLIKTIPYYYVLEDNESHTLADDL